MSLNQKNILIKIVAVLFSATTFLTSITPSFCAINSKEFLTFAQNNNWNELDSFITQCTDIDAKDMQGYTVLMYAIKWGKDDIVQTLLDKGANVNTKDMAGHTPLMIAVMHNRVNIAKTLLKYNIDVNIKDNRGHTAFEWATEQHNEEIINLLIDYVKSINSKNSDTAVAAVRELVNAETKRNRTPIMNIACWCKNNIITTLLNNGADINAKDNDVNTALHYVMHNKRKDNNEEMLQTIRILLNNGADINAKNMDGKTPFHEAAARGQKEAVNLLLNHIRRINPQNPDAAVRDFVNIKTNNNKTSLMMASRIGKNDIITTLLNNGADINVVDNYGWTALDFAAVGGQKEAVNLLLNHIRRINPQNPDAAVHDFVNIKTNNNKNAFIIAAQCGHKAIVDELLPYITDGHIIETAKLYAAENNFEEIINTLDASNVKVYVPGNHNRDDLINATIANDIDTVINLLNNTDENGNRINLPFISDIFRLIAQYDDVIRDPNPYSCLYSYQPNDNTEKILNFADKLFEYFKKSGINVSSFIDAKDEEGYNALMLSAQHYNEIGFIFVHSGANVNITNEHDNNNTAFNYALRSNMGYFCWFLKHHHARFNRKDVNLKLIDFILKEKESNFCKNRLNGENVGDEDPVVNYLRGFIDHFDKDENGMTFLMYIVNICNNYSLMQQLDFHHNINAQDNNGWTGLMHAVHAGHIKSVKFLIKSKFDENCDINIRNNEGKTALTIAKENNHQDIYQLLKEHGAIE